MSVKTNPDRMINNVITLKKININLKVITFFSKVASGKESPIVLIIKAIAVPIGTPFEIST